MPGQRLTELHVARNRKMRGLQRLVASRQRRTLYPVPPIPRYCRQVDTADGDEDWAAWIRWVMLRHGLNASQLARRVGVDRSAIHRWLTGKRTVTATSARAVAEALGEDPEGALRAAGILREQAVAQITDPDLLVIMRRLLDPTTPTGERALLKATLQALAKVADEQVDAEGNEQPKSA